MVWLFEHGYRFVQDKRQLQDKTFTTLISDKGQFYIIEIMFQKNVTKNKDSKVIIYDSLKILPFKVAEIAKGFNLPISKLEIDYHEKREPGHELTKQETEYLKNDVRIVAMALNTLFSQNLKKITQGSNAFNDYKIIIGKKKFERCFPPPKYDHDIRNSYKGGFTYLNPKFKDKDIGEGIVLDVNSLYPSVMYYNKLPYGEGIWFEGEYENDELYDLYIQTFTCQFELKSGYIPTIQIKHTLSFVETEYLSSSNGEDVILCLTSVDLKLFFEHYDVYNIEYISGWKFKSTVGLFKDYIDKWMKIKIESTKNGNKAMRTLAKLMLNALYGKFALNPKVKSKYPYYEDGTIKYRLGDEELRPPIYIPVGTFITSWARYKTISSAQNVYDRFVYADTDSLHLIGTEIPEGLDISDTELGMWKHESTFKRARFLRQKSYIEDMYIGGKEYIKDIYENDDKAHFENWDFLYLKITCAGMPQACYDFVTWDNFHEKLSVSGKLQPKHVKGGIVLMDIDFTIK
jgi:hypothetical protein